MWFAIFIYLLIGFGAAINHWSGTDEKYAGLIYLLIWPSLIGVILEKYSRD